MAAFQVTPKSRRSIAVSARKAAAILPLNSKGRWVGALMFSWSEPFLFDERDQPMHARRRPTVARDRAMERLDLFHHACATYLTKSVVNRS